MAYSLALEQAYLSKEFKREPPSAIRVVGTLLDSAFEGPPADRDLEALLARLAEARPAH